jgi:RNA polymerase sigma-70 factor, ECF subfamily
MLGPIDASAGRRNAGIWGVAGARGAGVRGGPALARLVLNGVSAPAGLVVSARDGPAVCPDLVWRYLMMQHSVPAPHCEPCSAPPGAADVAALMVEHLPALERRALQLCRNPADAKDLVQETCLRALRFGAQVRSASALKAWLLQVLRHVCFSRGRERALERRYWGRLRVEAEVRQDAFGSTQPDLLSPATESALRGLPEPFAQALILVDLNGYAYDDAARTLGVPIGTVMSRLHRARRWLRAELSEPQAA